MGAIDFSSAQDKAIEAMLRLAVEDHSPWTADDFADMLADQLDAPLITDLSELLGNALTDSACQLVDKSDDAVQTLRQLLMAPQPSKQLLVVAKEFAKALPVKSDFPRDIAKVIYYAILAVSSIHGLAISSFSDADLKRRLCWAMDQSWLDPQISEMMAACLRKI